MNKTTQTPIFACVFFPHWSIELAQRNLKKVKHNTLHKIILTQQVFQQLCVHSCSQDLFSYGIKPGMTVALAKALCPDIQNFDFDNKLALSKLRNLADWATRFSPLVGIDQAQLFSQLNYGIILDLHGTHKLYPDYKLFAANLLKQLKVLGFSAQIAIAPTLGAAWGLSRFGSARIIIEQSTNAASIKNLPVEALRIDKICAQSLRDTGIKSIALLESLPLSTLSQRFGTLLVKRLHQLKGTTTELVSLVNIEAKLSIRKEFESPLTQQESISTITISALKELLQTLKRRQERACGFNFTFEGRNINFERVSITRELTLASPSAKDSHLLSIITPLIEQINFAQGVDAIDLKIQNSVRSHPKQYDLTQHIGANDYEAGELLNLFTSRLGSKSVLQAHLQQSYWPENAFSFLNYNCASKPEALANHHWPKRPSYLLSQPQAIRAIAALPDSPPAWMEWQGQRLKLICAHGPERISCEWWKASSSLTDGWRDYFYVQDQLGRWWWLFRESSANQLNHNWFIHGMWC